MDDKNTVHANNVIKATFEALCLNGYPSQQVGAWLKTRSSIRDIRRVLGDALIGMRYVK